MLIDDPEQAGMVTPFLRRVMVTPDSGTGKVMTIPGTGMAISGTIMVVIFSVDGFVT